MPNCAPLRYDGWMTRRGVIVWGLALFGIVLLYGQPVLAVPESELATAFDDHVRPFIQADFTPGSFQGTAGTTLQFRARNSDHATGIVVVVNGRTEFGAKYDELLYDLRDLPVRIFSFDHRGQGMSSRLLADTNKGHVVSFNDYVSDLEIFIDTVVAREDRAPLIIVAHSMGGLVSALYANAHPDSVQGLILCAPMLGIQTRPFPERIARLLARGAVFCGLDEHYVPAGKPYDPDKPFSTNDVTHSEARFTLNKRLVAEAPGNALGSPTFGWLNQAFAGMDRLRAEHRRLTMPVLLLQAEWDRVVQLAPQTTWCQSLPSCTLVPLPGSGHEILMERDPVRDGAIARIRAFISSIIASPRGAEQP